MKTLHLIFVALAFSLSSYASAAELVCELSEDNLLVRSGSKMLDESGQAVIDLGKFDIYNFAGFVFNGLPATMIIGPVKSASTERSTDSVFSSTGSVLTIGCQIIE